MARSADFAITDVVRGKGQPESPFRLSIEILAAYSSSDAHLLLEFLERRYRVRRVHQRRPAAHIDGHAEGFLHLLTGGTEPDERFHVKADTAVAARCNRDRKRDQFFGLPVQGTVAASCLCQRREGLHGVGDVLAQFSQIAGNALSDVDVIFLNALLTCLMTPAAMA